MTSSSVGSRAVDNPVDSLSNYGGPTVDHRVVVPRAIVDTREPVHRRGRHANKDLAVDLH